MKIFKPYRGKIYVREEFGGLVVHHAWIYTGKSKSIVSRIFNYFSFVITSFFTGWMKIGKVNYLLCESPPLFLGITAFLLSRLKSSKLIFNVSDLWPESAEKLGLVKNKLLLRMSTKLEEFLYKKSYLISGQTQGIVNNISSRFPGRQVFWLKNGIDMNSIPEQLVDSTEWRSKQGFLPDDFLLLYAGIIGHAQGLEVILKTADLLRNSARIKFILIGDGPVKGQLLELKENLLLEQVFFFPTMPRKDLLSMIRTIDVAIIPLKKLDLFKGAIPSKIFENMALRRPLLLGVEGEAKDLFIDQANAGLAFIPEDAQDLADKINWMNIHRERIEEMGENGFQFVRDNFNWDMIEKDFREILLKDEDSESGMEKINF